jgi:hypothetical protein
MRHVHDGALHGIIAFLWVMLILMTLKLVAIHFYGHPASQAFLTVA